LKDYSQNLFRRRLCKLAALQQHVNGSPFGRPYPIADLAVVGKYYRNEIAEDTKIGRDQPVLICERAHSAVKTHLRNLPCNLAAVLGQYTSRKAV